MQTGTKMEWMNVVGTKVSSSFHFILWAPCIPHPGPSPSEYSKVSILLLSKLLLKVSSDWSHIDGSQEANMMQSQLSDV